MPGRLTGRQPGYSSAYAAEANALNSKAGIVPQAARKKAGLPAAVQALCPGPCLLFSIGRPRRDGALCFKSCLIAASVKFVVFHDALTLPNEHLQSVL